MNVQFIMYLCVFLLECATCKEIPAGWKMCAGCDKKGVVGSGCLSLVCCPMAHMSKNFSPNSVPCSFAVESSDSVDYLCPPCHANLLPATPAVNAAKKSGRAK